MKDDHSENNAGITRVLSKEMEAEFHRILLKCGFNENKARLCAEVFTSNSVDGVYTHGVNRFPRFVQYVQDGYIKVDEEPDRVSGFGCIEQWNGNLGPGPLNALTATNRAMEISKEYGMGCVAMGNTNHWMRGGLYGWKAAMAGFIFIGWTNTIANMPAWGASDSRLGNNPLVMAVPYEKDAIVLDMAMSQYSFGAIELYKIRNQQLAVPGGYDKEGNMTKDPAAILESQKGLPIGYWKGAGLSLLLDILATVLSGGKSTQAVTNQGAEYAVSQVFITIDPSNFNHYHSISSAIQQIISDYHGSASSNVKGKILFPGERVMITRRENLDKGIPVTNPVWDKIKSL